ncbi:hypothetical protein QIX46_00455 [Lysinibacillus boronitolerans]|nr:hypothetical protein QIX46_00455 [Lysinibacillus boronitolerans]
MTKKQIKTNIIVAVIILLIMLGVPTYLLVSNLNDKKQEEIERFVQPKELAFKEYKKSIEGILDSERKEDKVTIVIESTVVLEKMEEGLYDEYYNEEKEEYHLIAKEFDKRLDKLREEAKKNLNDSLSVILAYSLETNNFDYYRELIGLDYWHYDSKKNDEIDKKVSDKFLEENSKNIPVLSEEEKAISSAQRKLALQSVLQTGMSESEVRDAIGSPNDTHRNEEAEFWTYGDDVVLTMKNGYVYDITYSLE